jgi:hypothetical protein
VWNHGQLQGWRVRQLGQGQELLACSLRDELGGYAGFHL